MPLGDNLLEALRRIAAVADGSTNHEYVLGSSVLQGELASLSDPVTGRISRSVALRHLAAHAVTAKCRWYSVGEPVAEVLGYGYTTNNRRELNFLQRELRNAGLATVVLNVCDLRPRKRIGVETWLQVVLAETLQSFFLDRDDISVGLLHQLRIFVTSVQGAFLTLRQYEGNVFVVANDHSPAPAAWAATARFLEMRTIYVQHAEVSKVFPPLDFTLSVLRNQRSASIYNSIGVTRGDVVIAARGAEHGWIDSRKLVEARESLALTRVVDVVVYPSSVHDPVRLSFLLAKLKENSSVANLAVKPHPNARVSLEGSIEDRVVVLEAIPDSPHVAICGNSSIVVELLERGCIVLQDFKLDRIVRDYYGFVAGGLAIEITDRCLTGRHFWAGVQPIEVERLAEFVPRLAIMDNAIAALAVKPALVQAVTRIDDVDGAVSEAAEDADFARAILLTPAEVLAAARLSDGPLADLERTLASLGRLGDRFAQSCAMLVSPAVDRCDSGLDLWLLQQSVRWNNVSLSAGLRRAVRRYVRTFRRETDVKSDWVRATARSLIRTTSGSNHRLPFFRL